MVVQQAEQGQRGSLRVGRLRWQAQVLQPEWRGKSGRTESIGDQDLAVGAVDSSPARDRTSDRPYDRQDGGTASVGITPPAQSHDSGR
jgi:hypothetical protein